MKRKSVFILAIVSCSICFWCSDLACGGYIFDTKWGERGVGDGQFYGPTGISLDTSGNVYVADTSNRRIQKFTSDGTFILKWGRNGGDGSSGSGDGEFRNPRGLTVDSYGNVYVADSENDRVQKFNSDGVFITKWDSYWGVDIAIDSFGNTYIGEQSVVNGNIRKYSPDGTVVDEWETGGTPSGIAVDTLGNVYTACRSDNIIQKYSPDGTLLTQWGSKGSGEGEFMDPRGVEVDMFGNVYVADSANNRIQKFTSDGTFITQWGSYGSGDGQFHLPYNIAVTPMGDCVYVADAYNDRIQRFVIPEPVTVLLLGLGGLAVLGRGKHT